MLLFIAAATIIYSFYIPESLFIRISLGFLIIGLSLGIWGVLSLTQALSRLVLEVEFLRGGSSYGKQQTKKNFPLKAFKEISRINNQIDRVRELRCEHIEIANALANGQFDKDFRISNPDEPLSKALNKIAKDLGNILSNFAEATKQVSAGAQQVSTASQALSQGSIEQASAIQSISSAINAFSKKVQSTSQNANLLLQSANIIMETSDQGQTQVQTAIKTIEAVNNASKQISSIIKMIDDIAFQTNLLALNAAVESAHAGKHGKGFAVVAAEVRNLSARTTKAAKESADLIASSVQMVEKSVADTAKTAQSFGEIVTNINGMYKLVTDIAVASNEQADSISQVVSNISTIDNVTQSNTASSEETAAASEELSGQSIYLLQMISDIKTSDKHEDEANENSTSEKRHLKVA